MDRRGFILALSVPGYAFAKAAVVEGVTFGVERSGDVYLPVAEAAKLLGWGHWINRNNGWVRMKGSRIPAASVRYLLDGTPLVSLAALQAAGAAVSRDRSGRQVSVAGRGEAFAVVLGVKRVEADLSTQRMRAWQGQRLVLECRISSGRYRGSTPVGRFSAGPYKAAQHYSSKYDNGSMPWSVQIEGDVFFHGFSSVPDYPASHGCIRLPLDGGNPAKFFYEWVDVGTPVHIMR